MLYSLLELMLYLKWDKEKLNLYEWILISYLISWKKNYLLFFSMIGNFFYNIISKFYSTI